LNTASWYSQHTNRDPDNAAECSNKTFAQYIYSKRFNIPKENNNDKNIK
jgi:hypothetical protein